MIFLERTLVIIKPDAVNRSLVGEILTRFEKKGLKIVGMKMQHLQPYTLKEHYAQHKDKEFYNELISYMSSIPSMVLVLEGKEVVEVVRRMIGSTFGREAQPGTIRGDYSVSNQANLVHAAENVEKAVEEINRFFKPEELSDYNKMNFDWIYARTEKGTANSKK